MKELDGMLAFPKTVKDTLRPLNNVQFSITIQLFQGCWF